MSSLRLIKCFWDALPITDDMRWLITRLLLKPALPMIRNRVIRSAIERESEWHTMRIQPFKKDAIPTLPEKDEKKEDIVIWGMIDWRLRAQRPQHLAHAFAKEGHRVFYISTRFVNERKPGFEVECIDNTARLYNIRLHLKGRPRPTAAPPDNRALSQLQSDAMRLLEWLENQNIISIVQHPYWFPLVSTLPSSQVIYDCMDYHEGFGHSGGELAAIELSMLKEADTVVTTSEWLRKRAYEINPNTVLIRNAGEFKFFSTKPNSIYRDTEKRRVLGYYGAISEWLDLELIEEISSNFDNCLILLIGSDEIGAEKLLSKYDNIEFTGEVSYQELPFYLYGMDICLLPFRVMPLTIATNPVKVYEYLSAGKPVVSVKLPEVEQFGNLIATADTHEEFISHISDILSNPEPNKKAERQIFASLQTWEHRAHEFERLFHNQIKKP